MHTPPSSDYLSAAEVAAAPCDPLPSQGTPCGRAQARMEEFGQWRPSQALGRRYGIGCVALEITQRCNLDCSLCYLSESSEALHDLPLAEIKRRIGLIAAHYGPGTDVQVTGGDPTLRKENELVEIVETLRAHGLRASLFTNGIKATRELLTKLAAAGLTDVAFHVDSTQGRAGYVTETDLNTLREDYINRARGLPLHVVFNTTLHAGNLADVPMLARFFVAHADVVQFASFQMQADTGRGVLRERDAGLTVAGVEAAIAAGAGGPVTFGAIEAGHADCNRYALLLTANGKTFDVLADKPLFGRWLTSMQGVTFDRTARWKTLGGIARWILTTPREVPAGARWLFGNLWRMRGALFASRGRVGKISFFIHNFMDACHLDRQRVGACSFMVMTGDGPISMCVHNAKRDAFLLKPIPIAKGTAIQFFDPVTGKFGDTPTRAQPVHLTRKNARGRARVRTGEAHAMHEGEE
jgi:7,8-dihydro-6-hydroxymethylpterin dimethyltransferase